VVELRRLKGRNIFKVDLVKLQDRIQAQYPQIAQLQVMRELPDRIKVLAKKREAVLQIARGGKFLLVDADGVAMYYVATAVQVPSVQGAIGSQTRVVLGLPIPTKNMNLAVALLDGFKTRPHTSRLKVASVDVSNLSKIEISLGETLKVVIDQDNYTSKLDTLDMLVAQRKIDFTKVKYIDLRFNEPVLGGN